jgi:uncharacterized protein (UPF0332 family)
MSLHGDLLEQALHLSSRERKRPKQASLRRAISAAYYAVFHLILEEGAKQFVADEGLRKLVRRAFVHGEMKKAAKSLSSGGPLPDHIKAVYAGIVPPELRRVAKAFMDLQESRHEADYDLNASFTRSQVADLITLARNAFDDWKAVRAQPTERTATELFLSAMLLWDRWGKS